MVCNALQTVPRNTLEHRRAYQLCMASVCPWSGMHAREQFRDEYFVLIPLVYVQLQVMLNILYSPVRTSLFVLRHYVSHRQNTTPTICIVTRLTAFKVARIKNKYCTSYTIENQGRKVSFIGSIEVAMGVFYVQFTSGKSWLQLLNCCHL